MLSKKYAGQNDRAELIRGSLDTFSQLLESHKIQFQEESSVEIELILYTDHNIDFAGCFHIATAYSNYATLLMTFDKKAAWVTGVVSQTETVAVEMLSKQPLYSASPLNNSAGVIERNFCTSCGE